MLEIHTACRGVNIDQGMRNYKVQRMLGALEMPDIHQLLQANQLNNPVYR
jgi:hypothetical protein